MKHVLSAAAVLAALVAGPVLAQTTTSPSTTSPSTTGVTTSPSTTGATTGSGSWYTLRNTEMRASKLIGTRVKNAAGETIGDVNEILLDDQGRVAAMIVGVGGFLGVGEHQVAISPTGYKMVRDENGNAVIMVNATRDMLKNAPVVQKMPR